MENVENTEAQELVVDQHTQIIVPQGLAVANMGKMAMNVGQNMRGKPLKTVSFISRESKMAPPHPCA